jgi:hypothetical protein
VTLPPGHGPIPVAGIDAATDPEMAKAAGELNAWVDYLSNPTTNNGPRLYRPTVEKNISNQTLVDMPAAKPLDLENDPNYRVVSALDGFATMPDEFFVSAKAIAGIKESELSKAYDALTKGTFTFPPPADHVSGASTKDGTPPAPVRASDLYDELGQIRIDWLSMRSGWTSNENLDAQLFEDHVITFQVFVENAFLRIAEALVKYRMIFKEAGKAMATQMDGLTQRFTTYQQSANLNIDWKAIILTGITELVCAVITDGASAVFEVKTLATAGAQMLGEGGKSTTVDAPKDDNPIDEHPFLKDTVIQYVANMGKIEKDAASAINDLWMDLNSRLSQLEQGRRYTNKDTNVSSNSAPQFMDYAKNWRV